MNPAELIACSVSIYNREIMRIIMIRIIIIIIIIIILLRGQWNLKISTGSYIIYVFSKPPIPNNYLILSTVLRTYNNYSWSYQP